MLNSKEIRAQIAEKTAQIQAIVELSKAENRDLNDDERKIVDQVQGLGDQPGELSVLESNLERAIRFEARVKEIRNSINPMGRQQSDSNRRDIVIPATARVHGRLKAFAGDTAEQDAYVSGRWIAANFFNHGGSRKWLKEHGIRNALSTTDNEKGGLFVPTEMQTSIIRLVEQFGVFRRFSQIEPMTSDRKVVPVRVGGMTAYPVSETTTANEGSNTGTKSDPTYINIELVARKWKSWLKMSDEINEDSIIQIADQVTLEAALAFAYAEDNAGFNGDGTSTYHGIVGVMNALLAGSVYTAISGNTSFGTLDMEDFLAMVGMLPDFEGITPAWFISKEGFNASMHRLMMAAGGNDALNFAAGGQMTFLSYPVVFTNVLNKTLTTQTSTKLMAFGDLRMASRFGDRRSMTMSLTDQRYWDEDQIAIKATERFDINVHSRGTASEAGAMLVLQTPGS
jgi:HK97 family phage major capsid protein